MQSIVCIVRVSALENNFLKCKRHEVSYRNHLRITGGFDTPLRGTQPPIQLVFQTKFILTGRKPRIFFENVAEVVWIRKAAFVSYVVTFHVSFSH